MSKQRIQVEEKLKNYLPEEFVSYVSELMFSRPLKFTISKPRKSKAGDYRPPHNGQPHRISVNGNLNPYAFLITTLHEFAHLNVQVNYGNQVMSHGEEWKNEFRKLLIPIIKTQTLPKDIENALLRSINDLKASSCTDIHLYRALKNYDHPTESKKLLETIGNHAYFKFNGDVFQREELRRTRYVCRDVRTGKKFLINRIAEVELISLTDAELVEYQNTKTQTTILHDLSMNSRFRLQGKEFERGKLQRKKYLCTEISSGIHYLVHGEAVVEPIK